MGRQGGDRDEEEDDAQYPRPARRAFVGRRTEGAERGDEEGDGKKVRRAPQYLEEKVGPEGAGDADPAQDAAPG